MGIKLTQLSTALKVEAELGNIECLQFGLKTELSDDLRVFCMWLNNLSLYTGGWNIFRS